MENPPDNTIFTRAVAYALSRKIEAIDNVNNGMRFALKHHGMNIGTFSNLPEIDLSHLTGDGGAQLTLEVLKEVLDADLIVRLPTTGQCFRVNYEIKKRFEADEDKYITITLNEIA